MNVSKIGGKGEVNESLFFLTSLSSSFLIYKIKIILLPTSWTCYNVNKALYPLPGRPYWLTYGFPKLTTMLVTKCTLSLFILPCLIV